MVSLPSLFLPIFPRSQKTISPYTLSPQPEMSKSFLNPLFLSPPHPTSAVHVHTGKMEQFPGRAQWRLSPGRLAMGSSQQLPVPLWCRWGESGELASATAKLCQARMTKGLLQENNQNGRPWTAGREGEKTEGPGAGGGGREKGRVPGRGFFEKEPAWEKVSWKAARYGQGGNSGMRPSATWTMSGV